METIGAFSLEQHTGDYADWPLRTRLYIDGRETETCVPGFRIDAQYRCHAGYLLVLSWDCPYEESSEFVLLDPRFRILAHATLGQPYASYLLDSQWPCAPDALIAHYNGEQFFRVSLVAPRWWRGWRIRIAPYADATADPQVQAAIGTSRARLAEIAAAIDKP
jgi:hypothetical protein